MIRIKSLEVCFLYVQSLCNVELRQSSSVTVRNSATLKSDRTRILDKQESGSKHH